MTSILIIEIASAIAFIAVLAHLVKVWEERARYPEDPLFSVRESELCEGMHQWEMAAFLNPNELLQVRQDPKLLHKWKQNFCTSCGYVPGVSKMVKPAHLHRLRMELAYAKAVRKKVAQIEELEEQFWQIRLKDLPKDVTGSERVYFRMGYNAHGAFVDELPRLVEKLNAEASSSLEAPSSLPDAAGI